MEKDFKKVIKRLEEIKQFALTNYTKSMRKKKCYSSGNWDKTHADYMKNEADSEMLIWQYLIDSITDILNFKTTTKL